MEILGITLHKSMGFDTHIKIPLLRISPYLDHGKKVLLYKSLIKSQFNYCPLGWMFCSRQSNNLIKHTKGV